MAEMLKEVHPNVDRVALRELATTSEAIVEQIVLTNTQIVRTLTQGEYCVLVYLESCMEYATAVEIAERVSLTRPRITQIVSSLEHRGYVVRNKDDADKRKINIRISDSGRAVVEEQRQRAIGFHEDYLAMLGDDADAYMRILKKTAQFFSNRAENGR